MKKIISLKEYMDDKGNIQKKPKVNPSGDTGPTPAKKPQTPATKGKNWKAQPLTGTPENYATSEKPWRPKKAENGFADEGNKKLVYEPKTPTEFSKEGGKELKTFPKAASVTEFISLTKNMPFTEFIDFMAEQNKVNKDTLPPFEKNPLLLAKYFANLIAANSNIMETFIRELKKTDSFDKLVSEMFNHPEAYTEFAFMMIEEESVAKKLLRAFHEVTDAPASETEGSIKDKKKLPKARKTKSIAGQDLSMGDNDVVQTKATENFSNAIVHDKILVEMIKGKI